MKLTNAINYPDRWKLMSKIGKNVGVVIVILIVIAIAALIVFKEMQPVAPAKPDLLISNYPELFKKDVIIVVGENTTKIEIESAQAIAENLGNLNGKVPVIKKDVEITDNEKADNNLILVGKPDSNKVLRDVYNRTNATRVSWEYPGEYKGVLEILRNPWNESKAMLLIAGSDEWGVKVGNLILNKNKNIEHQSIIFVNWEEYTGVKFPIDSPEEAITYAKTDPDVKEFMEKWPNLKSWANLSQDNNIWTVSFYPADSIQDVWFEIRFKPDGTIIRKGIGRI